MSMESVQEQLRKYVASCSPIVYLVTFEEDLADEMIENVADDRKIYEWNLSRGRVDFKTKQPEGTEAQLDFATALDLMLQDGVDHHLIVLKDFHLAIQNAPRAVARLKDLALSLMRDPDAQSTILLVSSQVHIPPELEKLVSLLEFPLPEIGEVRQLIGEVIQEEFGLRPLPKKTLDNLALASCGLSRHEIRQLLRRGYQQDGAIDDRDIQMVIDEKRQIIKKGGILEMVPVKEKLEDIGGLEVLKDWLKQKAHILANLPDARSFGVESPKGVMIVGMPGCGKSLTAKAASALFNLPLLRLDIGSLMGKYVGESEANMRKALAQAAAVSPCVLWVDELEKAFAGMGHGGGGSSEVTTRLFGYFLTWMQEKTEAVFVLVTANDISVLPPELMRKGRFDEIFYVDFPKPKERECIFRIHLRKRGKSVDGIELERLSKMTDGFSGADIESVVKETIEYAYLEKKRAVETDMLSQTVKETHPLKEVMKDKIKDYTERFSKMRIRNASSN